MNLKLQISERKYRNHPKNRMKEILYNAMAIESQNKSSKNENQTEITNSLTGRFH